MFTLHLKVLCHVPPDQLKPARQHHGSQYPLSGTERVIGILSVPAGCRSRTVAWDTPTELFRIVQKKCRGAGQFTHWYQ
jgi:hypothetical protein